MPPEAAKGLVFTGMKHNPPPGCLQKLWAASLCASPQSPASGSGSQDLLTPHEMVAVCTHQPPQPKSLQWGTPPWAQRKEVGTYQRWLDLGWIPSILCDPLRTYSGNSQHQRRHREVIFDTVILNYYYVMVQSKSFLSQTVLLPSTNNANTP